MANFGSLMHKKQVFSPPLNNGAIPESLGLQVERKERILCKARAYNCNHGRERYSCVKGALKSWCGGVQHVEKFLRDNNLVRAGHILFGTQRTSSPATRSGVRCRELLEKLSRAIINYLRIPFYIAVIAVKCFSCPGYPMPPVKHKTVTFWASTYIISKDSPPSKE